jgi:hypothetical protein
MAEKSTQINPILNRKLEEQLLIRFQQLIESLKVKGQMEVYLFLKNLSKNNIVWSGQNKYIQLLQNIEKIYMTATEIKKKTKQKRFKNKELSNQLKSHLNAFFNSLTYQESKAILKILCGTFNGKKVVIFWEHKNTRRFFKKYKFTLNNNVQKELILLCFPTEFLVYLRENEENKQDIDVLQNIQDDFTKFILNSTLGEQRKLFTNIKKRFKDFNDSKIPKDIKSAFYGELNSFFTSTCSQEEQQDLTEFLQQLIESYRLYIVYMMNNIERIQLLQGRFDESGDDSEPKPVKSLAEILEEVDNDSSSDSGDNNEDDFYQGGGSSDASSDSDSYGFDSDPDSYSSGSDSFDFDPFQKQIKKYESYFRKNKKLFDDNWKHKLYPLFIKFGFCLIWNQIKQTPEISNPNLIEKVRNPDDFININDFMNKQINEFTDIELFEDEKERKKQIKERKSRKNRLLQKAIDKRKEKEAAAGKEYSYSKGDSLSYDVSSSEEEK